MFQLAESKIDINKNIGDVFLYITNMENFDQWFPKVIKVRPSTDKAVGEVGKVFLETVKMPLKGKVDISIEVKEFEKNKRFVTEGDLNPIFPRMTVLLSEKENMVTHVIWRMESRNKGLLIKTFVLPFIKGIMQRRATQGLLNLKNVLE
ncbi:SRPBCC family protein [Cytobacillus sp. Hm23]